MKKTKNLNIASRIAIATLSSIATSIIMITVVVLVFRSLLPDIYGIARVESNSYSLLNQMQWAQTISSINRELTDNTSDETKQKDLRGITLTNLPLTQSCTNWHLILKTTTSFFSVKTAWLFNLTPIATTAHI